MKEKNVFANASDVVIFCLKNKVGKNQSTAKIIFFNEKKLESFRQSRIVQFLTTFIACKSAFKIDG